MRRIALVCLAGMGVLLAAPAPSRAQLALGVQAGTIGIGGTAAFGLNSSLVFRGSVNVIPVEPDLELDQISYTAEFPTPQFLLTADFHPGGGGFYLSGGLHLSSGDLTVTASPTEPVEIGDDTYQPEEVGKIVGTASTRSVSPYLGIGLGNPIGEGRGIGLNLDVGVSFVGEPDIGLDHEGGNLSQQEEQVLQANLDAEARKAEDDMPGWAKFYPVISLGLSFKVGGR